jgi:hypothetical protein
MQRKLSAIAAWLLAGLVLVNSGSLFGKQTLELLSTSQLDQSIPTSNEANSSDCNEASDKWALSSALEQSRFASLLNRRRIQIYGWTEGAFTASSSESNQLPMGFNYLANDFLVQQNWLRIERTIDQASDSPSFGFLADTILPGTDYRFTRARGIGDGQTGKYGIDPVQFYAQLNYPSFVRGLDLKVGRFFGQYGVESIAAVDTPFLSRAYNFIYNPFTHTGILATLQVSDNLRVQNGIVTGSDVFFDSAAEATYIGSVRIESFDKKSSLLLATILGSGEFNQAENLSNPRIFDLVYTRALSEKLTYKLDSLYGYQENSPVVGVASWFAFVNYLAYDWSEQLQGNLRLEFFDDSDGNRTGFKGLYTAVTTGLTMRPSKCLILRPELRYDNNDSNDSFDGRSDLFTGALDVILRW